MTTPQPWSRIERALDELFDLPPEDRRARLAEIAAGDARFAGEVLALLEEGERSDGPLDRSPATLFGALLEGAAPERPAPPDTIGPYRVLRTLGRGGMGEVFLAERADGEFENRVALKVVRTGLRGAEVADRFRHERRILARLRHPNIASLYDGGATGDGLPWFAMEFVEGERITDRADRERLSIDGRIELFESVCRAVSCAHRSLVVHRDIKPANVLVTADGTVKLLDFGIAKIVDADGGEAAETTHRFLTPAYASPEHVRGLPTTTATDVWSLGVLLYELLAGRHPHGETSRSVEVVRAILDGEPRDPSAVVTTDTADATAAEIARRRSTAPADLRRRLRGDLDTIVRKAIRKEPEERYESVEDLRADLERHRGSLPIEARPATARYRLGKFARRNRVAVAAGAALLAAIVVFAVSVGVLYVRSERNLARALDAEREAARESEAAAQVSDFLAELFRVSNPDASTWEQLTARDALERGAERIRTELTDQPLMRARLLGTLGDVYSGLARYDEARSLYEEEIAIRREASGERDLRYAAALHNLARLLDKTADYEGALQANEAALAIREAALGPDHPDVAQSLNSLGLVHGHLGDLERSRDDLERALAIKRKDLGPDDESVGASTFNLGALHLRLGEAQEALAYFEEAHRIFLRNLGEDHMRTVQALGAIAGAMDLGGDPEGAREVLREVVERLEAALGPSHPEVGVAVFNLSSLERKLGDRAEPLALAERAHAIWRAAYGPDHPRVAAALGALADLRADAGDLEAAHDLALRGYAIVEALGLRNAETVAQLERLAQLERRRGDDSSAAARFDQAIAIAEEMWGAGSERVELLRASRAGAPSGS